MNRAGSFITNMSGEMAYSSYRPSPLPPVLALNDEVNRHLYEAGKALAELNAAALFIPNVDLFVSMYVRKEALLTSKLEGTQCTLEDIFDPRSDAAANLDVADVVNYVNAANFALERLQTLPLCNRLMREAHAVLMRGVRGQEKNPGEFRRLQNWIGAQGCGLKDARYIPPNPEDMITAMGDLEKYINETDGYDPLIRAALIHYQFETIHPFLDGNGRIGRLLILLYLMDKELLHKPILYVSYFFKQNQVEYYDRMSEVRRSGNYEQWVGFFLEAVKVAAGDALDTIRKLNALHDASVAVLPVTNRSKDNVRLVFDYLEQHPIIDVGRTASHLGISFNTAATAICKLENCGILQPNSESKRGRIFSYKAYLDVLSAGT